MTTWKPNDRKPVVIDLNKRQNEKQKFKGRAPKPKAWSHQDDLASLKGKDLVVHLVTGGSLQGTLVEADQYTLKIQPIGSAFHIIIYKSSITYLG